MKTSIGKLTATLGALVLALVCVPGSWAQCPMYKPAATHSGWRAQPGQALLVRAALVSGDQGDGQQDEPSIVGFWHFKFSIGGTVITGGNQQWHSDGTEIINDGMRPPLTGNICFGVWKKVGDRHYKLNHRGIGWNAEGTALQEVDAIQLDVTLSRDGLSYSGTFTISPFDQYGNSLGAPVTGKVTATRITVEDINPGSLF